MGCLFSCCKCPKQETPSNTNSPPTRNNRVSRGTDGQNQRNNAVIKTRTEITNKVPTSAAVPTAASAAATAEKKDATASSSSKNAVVKAQAAKQITDNSLRKQTRSSRTGNLDGSQWPIPDRRVQDFEETRNLIRIAYPECTQPHQRSTFISSLKVSKLDRGLFTFNCTKPVTYTLLNSCDHEYSIVSKMVTNKRHFKIDRIEKIQNPFLENAYKLKKLQKQREHGHVQEKLLFHATTESIVDKICTFNFDHRKVVRHKFGKGVSFSPNSTYASNYSDQNTFNKVMLVAKVLIVKSCFGNQYLIVPPPGYDTTQKGHDGIVIVKYEDSDYYPAFKIYYHTVGKSNQRQMCGSRRRHSTIDWN